MAITVKTVQVLMQSTTGGKLRLLGAVVDGPELERLTNEDSAMPMGTSMRECRAAVDDETNTVYVMGEPLVSGPLAVFNVDTYFQRAARRDAEIAKLSPEAREEVHGADWEPEADRIVKRTTEAKAARENHEAAKANAKRL